MMAYCFPYYVFGRVAESVGDNFWACLLLHRFAEPIEFACGHAYIRGKIREEKGIPVG